MGRRWIMVELGDHSVTHIVPRLKKVIDGEDKGGVTVATDWSGGGGFRFYRLAPSLLATDKWGHWVISKSYNAPMLAEAICKLDTSKNPRAFGVDVIPCAMLGGGDHGDGRSGAFRF